MAARILESTKTQFQKELDAYKQLQQDLSKQVGTRQQLAQQYSENDMVLEELKLLDDDSNVYKLIGPALVKQDLVEAKSNVSKRLEYIQAEIDRIEGNIKALETKSNDKQQEVLKLQQKLQDLQQSQASQQ